MNLVSRFLAAALLMALAVAPAAAQERTAVKGGFELAPQSGKTILVFRPTVRVGAQSTGGIFEPNADWTDQRSEEHTSELQSLMRISYAVFCLKKTKAETCKQSQ